MRFRLFRDRKRFLPLGMLLGFVLSLVLHTPLVQAATPHRLLAQATHQQSHWFSQAQSLTRKGLAHQQAGQWQQAQTAIAASITLLKKNIGDSATQDQWKFLGQALNLQGSVQLNLGQHEQALQSWQAATEASAKAGHNKGKLLTRINQTQALQELGFYRRALGIVTDVVDELASASQADLSLRAIALHRQGNLLRLTGDMKQSQTVLEEALAIAQRLPASKSVDQANTAPTVIGEIQLSLGHLARAQGADAEAIAHYKNADKHSLPPQSNLQQQLSHLQLLIKQSAWTKAEQQWPKVQQQLAQMPTSHSKTYGQINLAESLLELKLSGESSRVKQKTIATLLTEATAQSQQLDDGRAASYASGMMGHFYEQDQQWNKAQSLTQKAIELAEAAQASDILYQWHYQQGRILKAQGRSQSALAHFQQSIQHIKTLRTDLVAVGSDTQFSFQEDIEPVYREMVGLLLQEGEDVGQQSLSDAIDVIDALQVAELENYLQKACDQAQQIAQVDDNAAIIYPIVLSDRLEIILSLPHQPLRHYTTPVTQQTFNSVLKNYRQTLVIRSRRNFLKPARQLHQWLIQPMAADLKQSGVKTLVFVPDSALNNVPMTALYDGERFLLEDYSVAMTPSLRLLGPKPLTGQALSTLSAGISQASQGFGSLAYVVDELNSIQTAVPNSTVLLDQEFTASAFQTQVENLSAPILHLATHGQFSSDANQTFILAWDKKITLQEFDRILRQAPRSIELLVLSACETATGDAKAALGISGVAVEAGAKSTLATLWNLDDEASAAFTKVFYPKLGEPQMPRAEALRQSQLALLKSSEYKHPMYWAPYVMVGNWI